MFISTLSKGVDTASSSGELLAMSPGEPECAGIARAGRGRRGPRQVRAYIKNVWYGQRIHFECRDG